MQSNPYGYRYRSITVANFLGQAVKRGLDCHDLRCLQEEPPEDIVRIQESLMGFPRSVGDFFTWGPVTTDSFHKHLMHRQQKVPTKLSRLPAALAGAPVSLAWRPADGGGSQWNVRGAGPGSAGAAVPVLLGTNAHEGEMFVHAAFPVNMPKYVYWAFVGALFKDSAR
ncbi:unnamed protein product [Phaeothamnion confervicola]